MSTISLKNIFVFAVCVSRIYDVFVLLDAYCIVGVLSVAPLLELIILVAKDLIDHKTLSPTVVLLFCCLPWAVCMKSWTISATDCFSDEANVLLVRRSHATMGSIISVLMVHVDWVFFIGIHRIYDVNALALYLFFLICQYFCVIEEWNPSLFQCILFFNCVCVCFLIFVCFALVSV